MRILFFACLLALAFCVDPPLYNYSYRISFDQTWIKNQTRYNINGQLFYDPINNQERVDRTNGRYDLFCGTVLPNITTPCQQITTKSKRWIIFPQKSSCCFCCDGAHGCGILKPDWLSDAEYKGQEQIVDTMYDKWSKDGSLGYNYFWTTTNSNQLPRRLDQNGDHITDYNTHSFQNQTTPFPDSIFALPSYCNQASPANCPLQSICGQFRSTPNLQKQ